MAGTHYDFFIRAIEFNFCNFKNEAISSSIYKL